MKHRNQHDIFSVPIWGFVFKEQRYQSKDYIDLLLDLEKTEPSAKKSNSGGYQTSDNLHKQSVLKEFCTTLELVASDIIKNKVSIIEMWGNINREHNFNYAHVHGGVVSGVFYLKAPHNSGRLILRNPCIRSDGYSLRSPDFPIVPEDLACIFFPSWLEHYVEPNKSDEPRISLSFNFDISK